MQRSIDVHGHAYTRKVLTAIKVGAAPVDVNQLFTEGQTKRKQRRVEFEVALIEGPHRQRTFCKLFGEHLSSHDWAAVFEYCVKQRPNVCYAERKYSPTSYMQPTLRPCIVRLDLHGCHVQSPHVCWKCAAIKYGTPFGTWSIGIAMDLRAFSFLPGGSFNICQWYVRITQFFLRWRTE